MKLTDRISILADLGRYMLEDNPEWQKAKLEASEMNPWFLPAFIDLSVENISKQFLGDGKLLRGAAKY